MLFDLTLDPARTAPAGAATLVVIVHGLKRALLDDVPRVVRERMPDADLLVPRYDSTYFSNLDPVQLAADLAEAIQARCDEHQAQTGAPYGRIILIGHSRGALLVRKAYAFARGANHELWVSSLRPAPLPWAARVERIILLAGLNRGWSLSPKPPKMAWTTWLQASLADRYARLTRSARLMRGLRRGAPFVSNLRIQWIDLARRGLTPPTIQILGDMDDLVSSGDNIDLQAGAAFIYLKAPSGTTHSSVVDLDDPARRALFVRALETPADALRSDYEVPDAQRPDPTVEQVVFVMHGIRDYGGWTRQLGKVLAARAGVARRLEVITSSYGYFPLLQFLFLAERQKNVRWFMDRYTETLARYPNAALDFVGHSNGTYLLGSALRRYRACTFRRATLAGSVLPRAFEWDVMASDGRIAAVRNYLSTADLAVGVGARLFERFGDLGSGGFRGFLCEPATDAEFHYVKGSHGAALAPDNLPSIAAFLLDGRLEDPPESLRSATQSGFAVNASNLYWLSALAGLAILLLALAGGITLLAWLAGPTVPLWAWVAAFIVLLLVVLNSI